MPQERSEVIVLRAIDFSETSRIVTFLAPQRGRLACMAAGARRPKSELTALLDTFNRLEVVYYWKDSRSVQKLGEAALLDDYAAIKGDLDKSLYGSLPLEFAYRVTHENEPSELLYHYLTTGLASLAQWRGSVETHCCWQLINLLRAAGFAPNLESAGGRVSFDYQSGFTTGNGDVALTPGDSEAMQALASSPDACPDIAAPQKVFRAIARYAERHVETRLKSIKVISEMTH
jgi:DNA repair protein RecO (recombination protein O)